MALLENVPPAALQSASSMSPSSQGSCEACAMNPMCHPAPPVSALFAAVTRRRRLVTGQVLFAAGSPRRAVYAIRSGYLKATAPDGAGGEHIVRFLLPGDVVGLDSFANGIHQSSAVAVGDCEVCEIPAYRAELLSDSSSPLGRHLRGLVASDLARTQEHAATLARLTAIQRVAALLRELSRRWKARGYSGTAFQLPMGRREIGEHLGLTMETVSRILSGMREKGWIRLSRGGIEILQPAEIDQVLNATA